MKQQKRMRSWVLFVCVLITVVLTTEAVLAAFPQEAVPTIDDSSVAGADTKGDVLAVEDGTFSKEDFAEEIVCSSEDFLEEPSDSSLSVQEEPGLENSNEEETVGAAEETVQVPGIVSEPTVEGNETASYYEAVDMVGAASDPIPHSPFWDVRDPHDPYYDAICWAGNTEISKGFSNGTFRSSKGCSRGEFIVFLWRMRGKPAPSWRAKSPFKDVPITHAYYRAILWASQANVANGYADGTFGVDKACTRGHALMFLWKCYGKPAASATNKFYDVQSTHPYYKAICWGSQNGISKGFSNGRFGIDDTCTRGQAITFLYRAYLHYFYNVKYTSTSRVASVCAPVYSTSHGNYLKLLTLDKKVVSVSTVPRKVLFIGNSLLQGLGGTTHDGRFGMCASDSRHDYAYLVQQAILRKNSKAVFSKMSGTAFEGCTDTATAARWYDTVRNHFENDLDLIIVQLGDNANTNAKKAAFKKNVGPFLRRMKKDCPKARIVFVASWYNRDVLIDTIINECKANGCDFVSISGILNSSTMPAAGTVITFNDGTTAVATGGSLSHPNDLGMAKIAERIIAVLKL